MKPMFSSDFRSRERHYNFGYRLAEEMMVQRALIVMSCSNNSFFGKGALGNDPELIVINYRTSKNRRRNTI